MNAIDVIRTEHRALASVLSGLVEVNDGIAAGRFAPDLDLLEAMIRYITEVPDKVHHPKEDDFLFKALRKRSPDIGSVLDTLQADAQKVVTTCRDNTNQVVDLSTCLNAAAYSSYFQLTTDRVILK